MRLLHTADWHLGRTLEGRSRMEEQAAFFDELNRIVKEEKIDAILMAGDVFDTVNPPAAAEQLFYESMERLSDNGKRPIIIIAGNHDSPDRLSAASPLATKHNIMIQGYPSSKLQRIIIPNTEEILEIAALPYPSEARLNELLTESNQEELLRAAYDERIRNIFAEMSEQFSANAVRVGMSHLFVAGGSSTDSERPIEVGGAYTVTCASMPQRAQYTALGHLHRPQNISGSAAVTRYSGSPLAFSFSESGYAKSVTVIDVLPNSEAQPEEILLTCGKPLVRWKATKGLGEVYGWLDEGKDQGAWIDLQIHVDHALSLEEIQRLRSLRKGIIHIRPVFEEFEEVGTPESYANLSIEELFTRFYKKQTGGALPEQELIQLFLDLLQDEEKEEVIFS